MVNTPAFLRRGFTIAGARALLYFVSLNHSTMKQKTNINLMLWEIVWNNGSIQQFVWNGQQLAGFKRRKGIKRKFISMKKIAVIELRIKSAL